MSCAASFTDYFDVLSVLFVISLSACFLFTLNETISNFKAIEAITKDVSLICNSYSGSLVCSIYIHFSV